jgi:hypothetical protein
MGLGSALRRLWTPPADRRLAAEERRLAAAVTAEGPAAPVAAAPALVPLVSAAGAGAQRRRIWVDEQRQGIRTPWVRTNLHYRFEDVEPIWSNAEIGFLDPLARVVEAMRSEGTIAGFMDVRSTFVRKPVTFTGDPYLCGLMRGEPARFDRRTGRMISPGRKGWFRRMHPTAALLDLTYTAILAGVAVAEYVDDPVSGLPILQTRDLHRLRYDWGERVWKYRGQNDEYVVDPGDGRWVLFMPKSTHRPWRSGSWLPLMLAFIVMITATYDAARFEAKSADPLKWIEVPDEVPPDEVDRYEDFVNEWWERAPGIVLRYGAKAGITETNGIGHQIYGAQRAWARDQINFTLRGSTGTSGDGEGIFADGDNAYDVANELIEAIAEPLGECLSAQGIAPWFKRKGLIRVVDESPACSWDTRTPARKLAEAQAAGEVCDVVQKLDVIGAPRGKRVDVDVFFLQSGLTIPWESATELVNESGDALSMGDVEALPEAAPAGLLPESSTGDPVTTQTTPEGSLL